MPHANSLSSVKLAFAFTAPLVSSTQTETELGGGSAESEHRRKHLLNKSEPSSQTTYHQHTYEGLYSLHPQHRQIRQSRQSRQSRTCSGFTALASLLATFYILGLCALWKASDPQSLPVWRKLAEGRGRNGLEDLAQILMTRANMSLRIPIHPRHVAAAPHRLLR